MILKFFSVLVLISIALYAFKHKTKAKVLFVLTLLVTLSFSFSPVAEYLIAQVQTNSPNSEIYFSEKNVIVLLGGGSSFWPDQKTLSVNTLSHSRIVKAFEIYQKCKQSQKPTCHILITGGDPQLRGQTEAELIKQVISNLGASADDIIKEELSRNTKENAFYSSELIRNNNYSSVVLVTSGFHLTRAHHWFLHFKISSQIAPSDTIMATHKIWPSSMNLFYSDLALHELAGLLQIQIENYTN